jgi:DNA repair protein RadC
MEASQIKVILDPNSSEEERKTAQRNLEIIRGAGKRASGGDALKRSRLVAVERRILETEKALSEPTGQIPATKSILEDRLAELNEEKSMILYENPDLSAGQGMMQGSAEMPPGFQPLTP